MQIRCSTCTKTIAIQGTGVLPPSCPHCEQAPVPAELGAYVLERLIATGGMGEVYLARHHELGTEVAIKLLPALPLDTIDAVRQRFAREARLTAKIEHRGVVRVLASDTSGDRPYLVLELVSGETLRQRLAAGPLDVITATQIVAETADVLAAAHRQGVLHRDIKPDNVMLQTDGTVRVLDFGIARAMADDAPLTRTGELVGTPEYMAPEQLLDGPEATDERTDVHALGVLLYELLHGRSPYRSANLFQTLKLVESLTPPPPAALAAALAERRTAGSPAKTSQGMGETDAAQLQAVLRRTLEKRAEDRFASAADLAAALREAVPAARRASTDATRPDQPPHSTRNAVLAGATLFALAWLLVRLTAPSAPALPATNGQNQGFFAQTVIRMHERIAERAGLHEHMRQGAWCDALATSERMMARGDDSVRPIARRAFAYSHGAWLHVANLPGWLAAYDLGQRRRLFGDLLEPGNADHAELRELLLGGDSAWLRCATKTSDALHRLLAIRSLTTPTERADALAIYAQCLTTECPEHWLAKLIERRLRGDADGASQAAEMAWLQGAGELAVLLDAAMAMHPGIGGPGIGGTGSSRRQAQRLWRRLAQGDAEQCPASTLLMLQIQAAGKLPGTFDPASARSFPLPHRAAARASFLQQASVSQGMQRSNLLRVAVALWAVPDFAQEPWRSVSAQQRTRIQQEVQRVR